MEYRNEIGSGYELGDLLWSGARTNFAEWLDKGADADDILSCVEEYLGYGEELPTLTEINDFLWFEPETVESYLGLSSGEEDDEITNSRKPIRSGCHGKGKKDKDEKKKPVKSGYGNYSMSALDTPEITQADADEAYETIKDNNPITENGITYHKKLYSFDDGTSLYFVAAQRDMDDDTFEPYCKIGVMPDNSAMSEYDMDFIMPYNNYSDKASGVYEGDVYDTEIPLPLSEQDINWLNDSIADIIRLVEEGKLATR